MWYEAENGCPVCPDQVDVTSSRAYVYIRRNFELVPATEELPAHYRWQELKIPREMWSMCQSILAHDEAFDDVYAALSELAEIITEG